ncbi:hypothetical protein BOX15_Mlig028826g2 [Macrostomum lignano]|uniref:Homologous recombination OB-fold protein OB-fold domain-containing protein n=2 Tax=Macrostomum lignano TaxID=282301 RepID=A0A267G6Q3_9PLAT|nr:hypothetical protein BOX15_Mlig028826g2 [Macrostomum lignano]
MSSSLFVLDNNSTDSDGGPEGRRPPPPQASRLGPAAFDDEDDALFASVPMPDFANDDNAGLEAAAADPAVTGALSYGADCEQRPQRPAPSTVPKRQQNRPASSVQASSDETVYPVAQSTQLPSRQQHPHQTPKPKPPSSHRRSSSGKFPGPAGRLPRLKVPPDSGRGGQGVANAFVEAARKLNAAASAAAAAAAASRREERAATAGAGASAVVAASSQTSTISNASSSSGIDEEASWCAAAADLGPGLCRYLSRYSIAESLRLASSGQLPRNKVPAMLVIVETMDPTAVDCAASVKDATGRLQATLHRQVFRDLRDRVQPGAALVLRRVTLFSPDQRSYYLNITMDNIVRVYDRSGAPLQSNSSATAAASTLSNDEVQRLEAECLRPRTPPPKRVPESRYDVSSDSGSSSAASSATPVKRFRFAPVGTPEQHPQQHQSHPQSRQSYPQPHQSHHQSRQSYPQPHQPHPQSRQSYPQPHQPHPQSRQSYPQPHQSHPQSRQSYPQPHQSHPQSRQSYPQHPQPHPQSRQSYPQHPQPHQNQQQRSRQSSDTRVLQESYREAFEDNMDELLASALDDI